MLKVGLFGLHQCGKTSLFNLLTGQDLSLEPGPLHEAKLKLHLGTAHLADERLERLKELLKPPKVTPISLELVDAALGVSPESKVEWMAHLSQMQAILLVVRSFRQETVPHPLGSVDPIRDLRSLGQELISTDLAVLGHRREKLQKEAAKGVKVGKAEETLLARCQETLEAEQPLRRISFTSEELKILSGFQPLTLKPIVVVLNRSEDEISSPLPPEVFQWCEDWKAKGVVLPVRTELELKGLSPEEAEAFVKDLGVKLTQGREVLEALFSTMEYLRFYTTVGEEVRAWPIPLGTKAVEAAGKIHTDMARGFIRAEVVDFETFCSSQGSWAQLRLKGHARLEGKEYTVKDGDVIHFRFSV